MGVVLHGYSVDALAVWYIGADNLDRGISILSAAIIRNICINAIYAEKNGIEKTRLCCRLTSESA